LAFWEKSVTIGLIEGNQIAVMSKQEPQHWTRQEIIDVVTLLAEKRHDMSFEEFNSALAAGKIDICDDGHLIGLLNMMSTDAPSLQCV
jgi:hypothetical protein